MSTSGLAKGAGIRILMLLRDHGPQRLGDLARRSRISQPGTTRIDAHEADATEVAAADVSGDAA